MPFRYSFTFQITCTATTGRVMHSVERWWLSRIRYIDARDVVDSLPREFGNYVINGRFFLMRRRRRRNRRRGIKVKFAIAMHSAETETPGRK